MAKVSLNDIAHELNVSESLVSKVLNNRMGTTGASEELRSKIRETADRLGYRKNRTAYALMSGRQGAIAVFIHRNGEPGSGLTESITLGIAEELGRHDQRLWLHYFTTPKEFYAKVEKLHPGEVDGLIISGVPHVDMADTLVEWQSKGLPVITIFAKELSAELVNVGCAENIIGRVVAECFIAQGCTKFAQIGPNMDRRRGFAEAITSHGLPYDKALDVESKDFGYEGGLAAVTKLIETGKDFDCVFAHSDHQGLAVMHAVLKNSMKVPQQVKIVGVDNSPVCNLAPVRLSSVEQQFEARGREAVKTLIRMIAGRKEKSVLLDPVVVSRDSS